MSQAASGCQLSVSPNHNANRKRGEDQQTAEETLPFLGEANEAGFGLPLCGDGGGNSGIQVIHPSELLPRHRHGSVVRHRSHVEIAGRKAAPKDLSRGGADHPTERPGKVCRIREPRSIRGNRHRRAARELTGTTLQTQPEHVRS